jgi:hypothetical protein
LEATAEVRTAPGTVLQSTLMVGNAAFGPQRIITGTCSFTTEGLGITPSTNISLIQVAESAAECALLSRWFTALWSSLPAAPEPSKPWWSGSENSPHTARHLSSMR